ncbi:MAG: lysylphosphatidylglycerol synthase transmembrane domain-containing protein [Solirubrobacteraceae bacterium]
MRPAAAIGLLHEIAPSGRTSAAGGLRSHTRALTIAAACLLAGLLAWRGHDFLAAVERALHANWSLVAAGAVFEIASVAGYVFLLHRIVSGASTGLRLRDSYDISLAGTAATRLLPTAGLGGAAVTVWALRAHGVRTQELAERLLTFLLLLYSVFVGALGLAGAAIATGLVATPTAHGRTLGLLGVALAGAIAAAMVLVVSAPAPLARLLERLAAASAEGGRTAAAAHQAAENLPVVRAALRRSAGELCRPHPALLGAVAWWAFDIAVLFALLNAFGADPPIVVLVLGYFLGTTFNVLPLPGSLSGGLIGVLVALGGPAAPVIAAVLAYRALATWLPAATGLFSLGRLRGSVGRWRAEATAGVAPTAA